MAVVFLVRRHLFFLLSISKKDLTSLASSPKTFALPIFSSSFYLNRSIVEKMPKRAASATKTKVPEEQQNPAEMPKRAAKGKKKEIEEDLAKEVPQKKTRKVAATKEDKPVVQKEKQKPQPKSKGNKKEVEEKSEVVAPKKRAAKTAVKENNDTNEVEEKSEAVAPKKRPAKKTVKENNDTDEVEEGVEAIAPKKRAAKTAVKENKKEVEKGEVEEKVETVASKKRPAKKAVKENTDSNEVLTEPKPKGRATKKQKANEKNDEEEPKAVATTKSRDAKPANKTETDYNDISLECKTKNVNDQDYNLKIASWNVGGLRSWLKKGGLEFLEKEQPDILCIQETKCADNKIPEEIKSLNDKGYSTYWCGSKKEGYAGVGVLSKITPLEIKYGIGEPEHDDDGRCITAEYETFYLINVYVPNAGRKLVTLPKRLKWNDAFKVYVKSLDEKKPVILCGDMNVAHTEIDLANPKTNTKSAGFTKEEREGFTEFLADGYVDTFRKLYPDCKDAYTFWSYMNNSRAKNVGWRLDYFIVSDRIMNKVCDSKIRDQVFGSDHCPLTLFLHI